MDRLSLRDLCDVAYVLWVAQEEQQAVAVITGVWAAGAGDKETPTVADYRTSFDEGLCAPPEPESDSQRLRRELLGVA